MRPIGTFLIVAAVLGAAVAVAATQFHEGGTVNQYTDGQASAARDLATKAGYQPNKITMAQDGNIWLDARRGGDDYTLLATADNQLYASAPLPANGAASNTMAANVTPNGSGSASPQ